MIFLKGPWTQAYNISMQERDQVTSKCLLETARCKILLFRVVFNKGVIAFGDTLILILHLIWGGV